MNRLTCERCGSRVGKGRTLTKTVVGGEMKRVCSPCASARMEIGMNLAPRLEKLAEGNTLRRASQAPAPAKRGRAAGKIRSRPVSLPSPRSSS